MSDSIKEDEKGAGNITDYLQAPRKKRKNYVILALNPRTEKLFSGPMTQFVKRNFEHLAISHPETPKDLSRQFGRNISLLVIDDEFGGSIGATAMLVKKLKESRHKDKIPVLFLTRDPVDLIQTYHETLLPYHETDEYFKYVDGSVQELLNRMKVGLDQNRRRSRRYVVDMDVTFYHLERNENIEGRLLDLSLHGGLLEAGSNCIFKEGDQIRISLPVSQYIPPKEGEFLKLSCKVRRVFIAGTTAGVSFEYMSDKKIADMTLLLTAMVGSEMEKKSAGLRSKMAARAKQK